MARRARLYEAPVGEIVALHDDEVRPALARLRAAVASGRHVAGWIGYDAGYALEDKLFPLARTLGDTPLLWFGIFDSYRILDAAECTAFLGDPAAAFLAKPKPRIERAAYLAAATRVREHLFAGDYYQANLTFGCDVALTGAAARRLCSAAGAIKRWLGRRGRGIRAAGC